MNGCVSGSWDLDMPMSRTLELKDAKEVHCVTTGTEKDRFTSMLTIITSSGMLLSMYVIFKEKNPPKGVVK